MIARNEVPTPLYYIQFEMTKFSSSDTGLFSLWKCFFYLVASWSSEICKTESFFNFIGWEKDAIQRKKVLFVNKSHHQSQSDYKDQQLFQNGCNKNQCRVFSSIFETCKRMIILFLFFLFPFFLGGGATGRNGLRMMKSPTHRVNLGNQQKS